MRFKSNRRWRGSSRSEGKPVKKIILLVGLGLIAFLCYKKYIGSQLKRANQHFAAKQFEKAEETFRKVSRLPFTKGRGEDGRGALDLLQGNTEQAKEHFRLVLEQKPPGFGGDPSLILAAFRKNGLYESGKIYRDFLINWKEPEELNSYHLEFAALSFGARNLKETRHHLKQVSAGLKTSAAYKSLEELLEHYEYDQETPVLLDRNGATILSFDLNEKKYKFKSPKLFAGWVEDDEAKILDELDENDRLNHIQTTLDLNLQKAAFQAMAGYEGTMVLLEPKTGGILAAYGSEGHHPLQMAFEPGSVIKLLTYGTYLQEGRETTKFAPQVYPSFLKIGGRIFYDWVEQGKLETVEEGMAVSCNLMFAQMGIDVGWPILSRNMKRLFDGKPYKGYLGNAFFGRIAKEPENAWELGRTSIGLDFLETTVLGLALIPSAVANRGVVARPRLIQSFRTYEGTVYKDGPASESSELWSGQVPEKLRVSMERSLLSDRGTARRAKVGFVNAAMKTGTAGERPFDSVMVGLFPVENPKVAFSFFLHRGGKCEINGGKVAKRLQEQIRALAPEYLEK